MTRKTEEIRRTRGSVTVGSGILLSRIAGLVRERIFAHFFGASPFADAWRAALRMPNVLQNLLGEGTLSASFIPIYVGMEEEDRQEASRRFAGAVFGLLTATAGIMALLGVLLAPVLVAVFFAGFDADRQAVTVGLVRILFPMISEIEEVHTIRRFMDEITEELRDEGNLPVHNIETGIMIEIPGAIKLIKFLKDEVDFFSVGSNDLIQYLLAVERDNSAVSYLFNPFQPSVIESLFEIIGETEKIGKSVTVCGEIAGRPLTALLLLGMGYTNFSMNPLSIAEVKRVFVNVHYSRIKKIVRQLHHFSSKSENEEFLIESMLKEYPSLFVKQPVF